MSKKEPEGTESFLERMEAVKSVPTGLNVAGNSPGCLQGRGLADLGRLAGMLELRARTGAWSQEPGLILGCGREGEERVGQCLGPRTVRGDQAAVWHGC